MGFSSASDGGYYKFLANNIIPEITILKQAAHDLIGAGKNQAVKATISDIENKADESIEKYLTPAKWYIQECYYAAIGGYPKTAIKLAKLAILLIRAARYQVLPPNTLLPSHATDWVESAEQPLYVEYKNIVDQMNTAGSGAYYRMVQIVASQTANTDLEKFLETTPFPYGDGGDPQAISGYVNITNPASFGNIADVTYISSALTIATSIISDLYPNGNDGGLARLTRFLEYAKTYVPSSSTVNDSLYKIKLYDYIQYVDIALNNSKTLSAICSSLKTGISNYKANRTVYSYKKRLRFITSIQDSLERAQGLLVDISSRTARELDASIMYHERGWMDLSVAAVISTEIISRITNLERLIDAVEVGEQDIIDDAQTNKSNTITSSLNTINNKLAELNTSISTVASDNAKTNNRLSAFISSVSSATVQNGELEVSYQEPSESQLSGMDLLIETIRNAIYGSDMRQAIADAIYNLNETAKTLVNDVTALYGLYEGRLVVRELDTYFDWHDLTIAEKEANVIYLLTDDHMMMYKQRPYYFTSVSGGRTASFGSIDLNYSDVAFDLSLYSGGDLMVSSDVITDIELEDPNGSGYQELEPPEEGN